MAAQKTDPYFPCKTCVHAHWMHYKSLSIGKDMCLSCVVAEVRNEDIPLPAKGKHRFVPDNIKFIEDKR